MKRMKKTTRIPAGITQPDILMELLSYLPVKSLLRFRCVSKTWLDLISSPHFVKLHLNRSIQINPKIICAAYDDIFTIQTQPPSGKKGKMKRKKTQPPYFPEPSDFQQYGDELIRGSCNGLLCMSDNEDYMALWNPATKEVVEIPYPSIERDGEQDIVVGFGYDPVLDEYKIVESIFSFRGLGHTEFDQCEVKVCTLGTRKWRTVNDHPPCRLQDQHMPPLVSGALHWLGGPPIGSNSYSSGHKIVSFDICSEEFRVVPWIECITDTNHDTTVGVLQGSLSALISYGPDSAIHIWMMKNYGVKESWTKLFSIEMPLAVYELSEIEPLVLRENGEMILKSGGQLYLYNNRIGPTLGATYYIYYAADGDDDLTSPRHSGHIYAESLVSIKSLVGRWNDEDSQSYETGTSSEEED